jgi:uncharacterized membrane protein (Fun14 family)
MLYNHAAQKIHYITWQEGFFIVFTAGFALEELGASLAHGVGVYMMEVQLFPKKHRIRAI